MIRELSGCVSVSAMSRIKANETVVLYVMCFYIQGNILQLGLCIRGWRVDRDTFCGTPQV